LGQPVRQPVGTNHLKLLLAQQSQALGLIADEQNSKRCVQHSVSCYLLAVQPAFSKPSKPVRGAVFDVVITPADGLAT
jgi:hypothetical protein